MKKVVLLFVLVFVVISAYAQKNRSSFRQGDFVLGVSGAIGEHYVKNIDNVKIPAISLGGEVCAIGRSYTGSLGLGVRTAYSAYSTISNLRHGNLFFIGRAAFHYQFVRNLDTYIGVGMGIRMSASDYNIFNHNIANAYAWETFLGLRYYFVRNFGFMAEVSYGVAILNLGLVVRF